MKNLCFVMRCVCVGLFGWLAGRATIVTERIVTANGNIRGRNSRHSRSHKLERREARRPRHPCEGQDGPGRSHRAERLLLRREKLRKKTRVKPSRPPTGTTAERARVRVGGAPATGTTAIIAQKMCSLTQRGHKHPPKKGPHLNTHEKQRLDPQ